MFVLVCFFSILHLVETSADSAGTKKGNEFGPLAHSVQALLNKRTSLQPILPHISLSLNF
jgi:hypothetical protein